MAIPEYNYIPTYIKRTIANKPKDVVTASYWNELFNLLITQGDHTAEELGNILNHFTTVITDTGSELVAAIAEEHEYASAFEIHLFTNVDPITADKSFAEIRQAIIDGRDILLHVDASNSVKPVCNVYDHFIALTVFDYHFGDHVLYADFYECSDTNEWYINENMKLADYEYIGDTRNLTTAHKSNLVAAINEVKGITDGKYVKPTDGIPKTDLAAAVQTSLGKADTALQEHQSLAAYRTAEAQNTIDNSKQDKLIAGENITISADGKTISAKGGGGILPITLTLGTPIQLSNRTAMYYTADRSQDEIKSAIDAGITVLKCSLIHADNPNEVAQVLYLNFSSMDSSAYFVGVGGANAYYELSFPITSSVEGMLTLITLPTATSQLENDSGYLTLATLPKYGGESV